jgi:hypothetical protein
MISYLWAEYLKEFWWTLSELVLRVGSVDPLLRAVGQWLTLASF